MTDCYEQCSLVSLVDKRVNVDFSGGDITSDAGSILLAEADRKLQLVRRITTCLQDNRHDSYVRHDVESLVRERLYLICLGYEDCNDAQVLRSDPALKVACGRRPVEDESLASQPTLSRFENSVSADAIVALSRFMLDLYIERKKKACGGRLPKTLTLDLDSTGDRTYGQQEFSFFNTFRGGYSYHPLVCTEGGQLLGLILRPGNVSDAAGVLNLLPIVVRRLRRERRDVRIIIRADSGFESPELLGLCDDLRLEYFIGLGYNSVLKEKASSLRAKLEERFKQTLEKQKGFLTYRHRNSRWSHERQVVTKVEVNSLGVNIRHITHSIPYKSAQKAYERYCRRGQMENEIKDLKNALAADRLSCHRFEANAFRFLMHGFAYVLMDELRDSFQGTHLARAQFDILRLRVLKIGALVSESVRRVWIRMATSYPLQGLWWQSLHRLQAT